MEVKVKSERNETVTVEEKSIDRVEKISGVVRGEKLGMTLSLSFCNVHVHWLRELEM